MFCNCIVESNEAESNSESSRPVPPDSKDNVWVKKSQRLDTPNVTSRVCFLIHLHIHIYI